MFGFRWFAALSLALILALAPDPGAASGKGKAKHFKFKSKHAQQFVRFGGGPPPWAPAHGYRRKHGGGGLPLNLDLGSCNRELLGSLLGAAAGGLAGSQIGDGRGQLAATAGGTLLGFLIGGNIGRSMDDIDQNCIGQALEHAPDGKTITWNNPDTGRDYQVTPSRTIQQASGAYCREYTAESVINGRTQQTYGKACRQPDGSWRLKS